MWHQKESLDYSMVFIIKIYYNHIIICHDDGGGNDNDRRVKPHAVSQRMMRMIPIVCKSPLEILVYYTLRAGCSV